MRGQSAVPTLAESSASVVKGMMTAMAAASPTI